MSIPVLPLFLFLFLLMPISLQLLTSIGVMVYYNLFALYRQLRTPLPPLARALFLMPIATYAVGYLGFALVSALDNAHFEAIYVAAIALTLLTQWVVFAVDAVALSRRLKHFRAQVLGTASLPAPASNTLLSPRGSAGGPAPAALTVPSPGGSTKNTKAGAFLFPTKRSSSGGGNGSGALVKVAPALSLDTTAAPASTPGAGDFKTQPAVTHSSGSANQTLPPAAPVVSPIPRVPSHSVSGSVTGSSAALKAPSEPARATPRRDSSGGGTALTVLIAPNSSSATAPSPVATGRHSNVGSPASAGGSAAAASAGGVDLRYLDAALRALWLLFGICTVCMLVSAGLLCYRFVIEAFVSGPHDAEPAGPYTQSGHGPEHYDFAAAIPFWAQHIGNATFCWYAWSSDVAARHGFGTGCGFGCDCIMACRNSKTSSSVSPAPAEAIKTDGAGARTGLSVAVPVDALR